MQKKFCYHSGINKNEVKIKMEMAHIFECCMLLCFGFSWPLNVIKAYKARTAKGTSLAFITLIITGYLAGIAAKIINAQFNYVLAVYFLNLAIVFCNVIVYARNKSLDNKKASAAVRQKIADLKIKIDTNKTIKVSKEDNMNFKELNGLSKKNQVVLLGGTMDKEIPVTELAQAFSFNFELYNRSATALSVKEAKAYFEENVSDLKPEGIILHLGDNDISAFQNNAEAFDKNYLSLLAAIKAANKKCRVALVNVNNPKNDKIVAALNSHIKALAASEKCVYVNLENAKLWNPKANLAASAFARNMGVSVRKPLNDVAEILYSYAYLEIKAEPKAQEIAG
ncbi:MAG: SGNH/GDSL hydrolase family protein [Treponema sp.]|nr:SGNH/GDSL hydrolase family protein [Treponema sp.]